MGAQLTVREAYLRAASFLKEKQIGQDPERVTEWLMLNLLGWNRTDFFLRWNEPFPLDRKAEWDEMLRRKANGEPVQYITCEQQFMGLDFNVSPDVLIPRPETEVLVEHMIQLGNSRLDRSAPITAADVGTGSGAIPVSMAVHCPDWKFYAVDISQEALYMARQNAKRHDVENRITFLQGDLLSPLKKAAPSIDMLISNPPYIPSEQMAALAPEVGGHEPKLALDGGEDGLKYYRKMVLQMKEMDFVPKMIGFELGLGQDQAVIDLLDSLTNWSELKAVPDLTGRMRHVIAIK